MTDDQLIDGIIDLIVYKPGHPDKPMFLRDRAVKVVETFKAELDKWISIEKQLPGKDDYFVIAYDDDIGTEIMKYENGCFYVWGANERDEAIDWYPTKNVTHWMSYPKDPK